MDDNQSSYFKIKSKLQHNRLSVFADTASDVKYVYTGSSLILRQRTTKYCSGNGLKTPMSGRLSFSELIYTIGYQLSNTGKKN